MMRSFVIFVAWLLLPVYANETDRMACMLAINDFEAATIDSSPDFETAAEAYLETMDISFPEGIGDPLVEQLSFSDETTADYDTACVTAGGRFSIFTGTAYCAYVDGMLKDKHTINVYVNMAQCFSPTGCESETIVTWLGETDAVFQMNCTFVDQDDVTPAPTPAPTPSPKSKSSTSPASVFAISVLVIGVVLVAAVIFRGKRQTKTHDQGVDLELSTTMPNGANCENHSMD
jgi:hypothetical protein